MIACVVTNNATTQNKKKKQGSYCLFPSVNISEIGKLIQKDCTINYF